MKKRKLDRRRFLGNSAGIAAGSLLAAPLSAYELVLPGAKTRVVDATCPGWLQKDKKGVETVQAALVKTILHEGLKLLTGKPQADQAIKEFVSAGETVAIKFNRLSENYTRANQALLDALTELLLAAGVKKNKILVLEGLGCETKGYGTPDLKFGKPYKVLTTTRGGKLAKQELQLTALVEKQADCIINIPDLKNHIFAGITGALKNISHGTAIMQDPKLFHGGMCDPATAEINNLKPLQGKIRLVITNALKGVFDKGPATRIPGFQFRHNGLLLARDQVAVDRVAWELINGARKEKHRRPIRVVPTLETAAKYGLGTNDLKKIDWLKATIKAPE